MQMSDEQRAQFTAQLEQQQKAGLVPVMQDVQRGDATGRGEERTLSATGLPPGVLEQVPDGNSLAASAQNLTGAPVRLTVDSDPNQTTIQVGAVRMLVSTAVAMGVVMRQADGRLLGPHELAEIDAAHGQPSANDGTTKTSQVADPSSPEEKAAAEEHSAVGAELAAAEAAWQQHGNGLNVASVALAYMRGQENTVQSAVDILVRTGLATDSHAALGWIEDTAAHAENQLERVLNGMSLDGRAVLTALSQDKALVGDLERASLAWLQSGQVEAWAPLLQLMAESGKLAKFVRAPKAAA